MARAVVEIQSRAPQGLPRERVDLRARRSLGENRARDRNVPFQHASEPVPHFPAGLSHRNGPCDIGGAVFVLAAAIDQEQALSHL